MTRYLAIIHRDSYSYALCPRGCCGTGFTEGLYEECCTEDRSEVVRFLVNSYVTAALHESDPDRYSELQYAERTHSLFVNGLSEKTKVDEFSEEDSEKRSCLAEIAAIRAEVELEVENQIALEKVKQEKEAEEAEKNRIAKQRESDIRRLEELERQKEALQAKLQVTP